MDLDSLREGQELPDQEKPEAYINPLFELVRDHMGDEKTATIIKEVESTWREFEEIWDGQWNKEPAHWEHPENLGAQLYDAGNVAVNLRNAYRRLDSGTSGAVPRLRLASKAAQSLLRRERKLLALGQSKE